MISSVNWVPAGAAARKPERFEVTDAAAKELRQALAAKEASLMREAADQDGLPAELRMDDYGEEHDTAELFGDAADDEGNAEERALAERMLKQGAADDEQMDSDDDGEEEEEEEGSDAQQQDEDEEEEGKEGDAAMDDDDVDAAAALEEDDDGFESDEEDIIVNETDRLILAARTDEEFSNLEVYLYDEEAGNMFVHHEIALPAFPLCTAWLGCGPAVLGDKAVTPSRNYVAVGTFKPEIEVWNLDVLDALEPTLTLGGKGSEAGAHKDAVMGLSWNASHHHLLASGSGDNTVKLWDLSRSECVRTFTHHESKVQSVQWNPVESSVLLSGSFDSTLAVFDASVDGSTVARMKLGAEVESCAWNPHRPEQVFASTEDGNVVCFDVRNTGAGPLFSFAAHPNAPCSGISFSALARGLLATCSPDRSVKLWDLEASGGPKCFGSKVMSIGKIFDVAFDMDEPFVLAAGGSKGELALWDTSDETNAARMFKDRVVTKGHKPAAAPAPAAPVPAPAGEGDGSEATDSAADAGAAAAAASPANKGGKKKGGKKKKGKKRG